MILTSLTHEDLIKACLTSDEDAWKEFKARYNQVISLAVLRTARRWGNTSKDVLEDLIGDTYLKICAKNFALLRNFQFRTEAGIYGFLKVVATNVVHDHFRPRPKPGTEVSLEELYESADPPMPSRMGPDDIERNVVIKEIEEALCEVTGPEAKRDRTIFWLYFRQGFSAEAIAALPWADLSTKGVESAIHRLKEAVRRRFE